MDIDAFDSERETQKANVCFTMQELTVIKAL
jgi:hypothetical protein